MNGREIALKVLDDVLYKKAYSNIALNKHITKNKGYDEENFIRELVYGVLENKIYLDSMIFKLSNIKKDRVHKDILNILRLGSYQLIFMDRIPESAAVNESVNLAKLYGNKGSVGYVNGLLRNIARKKEELLLVDSRNKRDYLATRYSYPDYLIDYFIDEFGQEFTEELLEKNNERADFNIRYNPLKINKKELRKNLEKKGYNIVDAKYGDMSMKLENPKDIFLTYEYYNGFFTVQDESSTVLLDVIDPKAGSKFLDACAAPGGKSTGLAEKMNNEGFILSRDIHKHRIKLIEESKKRLGIDIIKSEVYNSKNLDEKLINSFDYVLVDAPCSGLGTIRRSPEIKYSRTMEDIERLSKVQLELLETLKMYVKTGGYLYYSTCSIGSIENDRVVEKFLAKNPSFKIDKIEYKGLEDENGFIKLYTNLHNTDGFFISRMKKERKE